MSLFCDNHKSDDFILCEDNEKLVEAVFNLFEDIACLREDIVELKFKLESKEG